MGKKSQSAHAMHQLIYQSK